MKNKKLITVAVFLPLLSYMLFSCKKSAKVPAPIVYDSIVVKKQIPMFETNDTTLPFADVKVSFIYPEEFGSKEDLARLQQIFIGTFFQNLQLDSLAPQAAVEAYLSGYMEEYRSLAESYNEEKKRFAGDEAPLWYWYYMYNTNKVVFQNDLLLSYAVEYSDYTGGAHGSHQITYTNIDLGELVTISEEDIFLPDYEKSLGMIITSRLMMQYNVTEPDSLINHGFFDPKEIAPNNNFWLDDKGIHYAFNQYEIAPYSMGVIDVDIPYEDLGPILKPEFLKKYFSKRGG
ncbi:MAG: DUF3298 domain-containing protein [Petrimonas mucosa]|jgi:hypothetical protein|uniref:DUF3298 and DUF4163 domain-containing protein n=1 Tax=Petrimonas mucosa TaxID=1642646 RepID=UPI0023F55E65|nr:DUF3298 and DUF4163 domain-containing protein [Petrimonas mucosa]MDD3560446.1 DUF3298 domain-containing protein [Petrimonas mucosa]